MNITVQIKIFLWTYFWVLRLSCSSFFSSFPFWMRRTSMWFSMMSAICADTWITSGRSAGSTVKHLLMVDVTLSEYKSSCSGGYWACTIWNGAIWHYVWKEYDLHIIKLLDVTALMGKNARVNDSTFCNCPWLRNFWSFDLLAFLSHLL